MQQVFDMLYPSIIVAVKLLHRFNNSYQLHLVNMY